MTYKRLIISFLALGLSLTTACGPQAAPVTPTPTKTATPVALAPTATPAPPTATATPTARPSATPTATASLAPTPAPSTATPTATPSPTAPPQAPPATATPAPTATPVPTPPPAAQVDFVISELRVLGLAENNGGIELGGLRNIYVTVVDAAGNPIDGAVVVNTAPYPGRAVTGEKGPGKAEFLMDREEFRLAVESVAGVPVSSETSHTMSLISPVPSDIAGKLGDACPTVDNCPLPPYKHFSYVITFRRTY